MCFALLVRKNQSRFERQPIRKLVFCCHNSSNILWDKIVLVWGKKLSLQIQGWMAIIWKKILMAKTNFSHNRSEQFSKQNTIV